MGRDLHEGYSLFIQAARDGFGGREWVNTDEVAQLIGCKRGHALRVMRAIAPVYGTIKEEKGRYWLNTSGKFNPSMLAGWIEMDRQREKHDIPTPIEPQPEPMKRVRAKVKLPVKEIFKKLSDHEQRIADLEAKLKSSQYVEPKEVRRRWFRALFA